MANQTKSTVIAPSHKIPAGYKYDGSLGLNQLRAPLKSFPGQDDYIISYKGSFFETIKNVRIDKNKGVRWDYTPRVTIPYFDIGRNHK